MPAGFGRVLRVRGSQTALVRSATALPWGQEGLAAAAAADQQRQQERRRALEDGEAPVLAGAGAEEEEEQEESEVTRPTIPTAKAAEADEMTIIMAVRHRSETGPRDATLSQAAISALLNQAANSDT